MLGVVVASVLLATIYVVVLGYYFRIDDLGVNPGANSMYLQYIVLPVRVVEFAAIGLIALYLLRKKQTLLSCIIIGLLLVAVLLLHLGYYHWTMRDYPLGRDQIDYINRSKFWRHILPDSNNNEAQDEGVVLTPAPGPELTFLPLIPGTSEVDTARFPEIFDDYDDWNTYASPGGELTMQIPMGVTITELVLPRYIASIALVDEESNEQILVNVYRSSGTRDIVGEAVSGYAYGLPEKYREACGLASIKPGRTAFRIDGNPGFYIIQRESSEIECVLERRGRAFALIGEQKNLVEIMRPAIQVVNPNLPGGGLDVSSLRIQAALQTLKLSE